MILICYDGSDDAKAAIARGGELLRGHAATVLTVWEPFARVLTRYPTGLGPMAGMASMEEIDATSQKEAERRAQEGAELARKAGLDAQARTCSDDATTARAILAEADALSASAILMGSRGLSGLKSMLLGSVSHAVIQQADRTVIIAPLSAVRRLTRPRAARDRGIALNPQCARSRGAREYVVHLCRRRCCADGRRPRAAQPDTMATGPLAPGRLGWRPSCSRCGDVIGVYERLVEVAADGLPRVSSRAAEPRLSRPTQARLYHGDCYETDQSLGGLPTAGAVAALRAIRAASAHEATRSSGV